MSCNLQKCCYKILNEYFGDIVARVGDALFQKGLNPLRVICAHTKLPHSKVSEALAVLVQHNLVTWEEWRPQIPGYTLLHDRILLILRFPRYVYLVREQYGEEGEMVVDVLLKEGQATASSIIITSCIKLYEAATDGKISVGFWLLFLMRFLCLGLFPWSTTQFHESNSPGLDMSVVKIEVDNALDAIAVFHSRNEFAKLSESLSARIRYVVQETQSQLLLILMPDLLEVNYDNFTLSSHYSQTLLEISETVKSGTVLSRVDPLAWRSAMLKCPTHALDPGLVAELSVSDILNRDEEKGLASPEDIVVLKIAQSSTNRLIRKHRMMEQDQIGELSMIGKKEANLLSYRLLHDNFLRIHEQRKTLAPSPANKIIYLFHVDMNSVVRMILEWCYKGLYNLMVQREMRANYNRRLLEKRTRVDTIVENLKQSGGSEEQIQEVEEMVTPSERSLVEQVLTTQDKLFDAETGLDDTVFILQMYLYYQMQKD
ncbi:LOW QUALITY PROTEIN: DNA-directed RNA polymerase III subunit RPC3-like [Penaeus monodon]|uniref:LOW QUALITY PROTEIN: DNA-directed RNA polymerase III subunit RPC3-like n=1 Tax=Penaeus monodon TaxID=6687 RepID=UPI0018A6EAB0|nr:LOW QUALITY PROTEIN: DNA-directed RNA polymerase III subunit RPC3-like [Penaeus monodon]